MLSVPDIPFMLSLEKYAECCYAECRGNLSLALLDNPLGLCGLALLTALKTYHEQTL
jgi:hypothetical protein